METNKKLEDFVNQIMSNDELEAPSSSFTDAILNRVESVSNSKITVYKPLISKQVWFLIISCFIGLAGYVYLKEPVSNSKTLETIDFSKISFNPFEYTDIVISGTTLYAVLFLAIMLCVQIPVLKYYFNKRLSI